MPNFANWMARDTAIDPVPRAIQAWSRILDKPTTLTIRRKNLLTSEVTEHTITVRLEMDNEADEYQLATGGWTQTSDCTVFGIQNHPTEPDTDLLRSDEFVHAGIQYRVLFVKQTLGELQFECEMYL